MSTLRVLLCTEGTYPFAGGGVSTWCDILCRELGDVDFSLYAVTGLPETAYRYEPPANVSSVIHVPLWGMTEPAEHLHPHHSYAALRARRDATTAAAIEDEFVPLLRGLMAQVTSADPDSEKGGRIVHKIWCYFRTRDWHSTWRSEPAWRAFVEESLRAYEERPEAFLEGEAPSIYDLTTAMQWLYAYLMPLYAPVPEVDIVHATIAGFAALPAIVAKYERGTPLLLTEHGVYIRERYISISASDFTPFAKRFLLGLSSFVGKLAYHHADKVCPVADFNRRWEEPYGCAPERIETIYNGVDPETFQPRPKPATTAGTPTVVAAARVFPLKDIENMIRSAAVARERVPDVRYLLYGSLDADIPYTNRCKELVAELELEQTFEFGGMHNKPAEIYAEGDISILSSISEGFPFTVLESMACARPVAGTDVGGVREALQGFGLVVPPLDPAALGEATATLLSDDEFRAQVGRRAREQVLAHFRVSQSVDGYARVYADLVGAS